LKRIIISEEANTDIRAIPQHLAISVLTAIHRLAESDSGDVKTLNGKAGEKRLRVGHYHVRFTEEHPDSLRIHAAWNRKSAYR
jgi:hypothetical protein